MTKELYEKRFFTISKTTMKGKVQFMAGALAKGLSIWWLVK